MDKISHNKETDTDEVRIAKHLGEQISGKFYCPKCAVLPDYIQEIYVFGGCENVLFCPHCELTVKLSVTVN